MYSQMTFFHAVLTENKIFSAYFPASMMCPCSSLIRARWSY